MLLFEEPNNLQKYINSYINRDINFVPNKCLNIQVANCKLLLDFNTCIICKDGYSLVDNACKEIGNQLTGFCTKKLSADKCSECMNGYFVSGGQCAKVRTLPHCIKYDNSEGTGQCQQCEDAYYLKSAICTERRFSLMIDRCEAYSAVYDRCDRCGVGFRVTDDGLSCLAIIENCIAYKLSSYSTLNLLCSSCIGGYQLSIPNNLCVSGTIDNCYVYDLEGCAECQNGYYLNDSGTCAIHRFSAEYFCKKWSQTIKNKCDECNEGSVKVSLMNSCRPLVNPVDNCLEYNSQATQCAKCKPGYHIDASDTCSVNTIDHCDEENGGLCIKCGSYTADTPNIRFYYELSSDQLSCKKPYTAHIHNCLESESEHNGCLGCSSFFYPSALPYNTRLCYPKDFYKLSPSTNSGLLADCEVFDIVAQRCLRCAGGKVLDNNTCIPSCSSSLSLFVSNIQRDLVNDRLYYHKENYCDTPLVTNCEVHDVSLTVLNSSYGGVVKYGCVKCKAGYLTLIDLDKTEKALGHYYNKGVKEKGSAFAFID